MIHETKTCDCEMCAYFDKQMAEDNTLHIKLPRQPDDAYFDFLWQYGPPSRVVGVTREQAAWWFQMGRASRD